MDGVVTGVSVGVIMLVINLAVSAILAIRRRRKTDMKKNSEMEERISDMEQAQKDTHELVKLSLRMIVLLGDGMVQGGVNGEVKRAFEKMKQEVLQKL
jgi:predicted histidine transporter YuiF (NhaC family)